MEEASCLGTDGLATISPKRVRFNKRHLKKSCDPRRLDALRAYAVLVAGTATGLTAALVLTGRSIGSPVAVGVLCVIGVYAEAQTVRLGPAIEVSVASIVFVLAAVLFGPLAAIVVASAGLLTVLARPGVDRFLKWVIWTSSRALIAGAAGAAAMAFGARPDRTLGVVVAAVAAAAAADLGGDLILTPIPAFLRGNGSWREITGDLLRVQVSALPLHIPLISMLAYAYLRISPWSVVLFVVPALAAQRLFLLYRQQRETADELYVANTRLANANLSFATALVATLDARDRYTAGHSAAVAIYARDITVRMGLSTAEQDKAHLCGLVHDIGKIGLPAGLLEKAGVLTLDERRQMEEHSEIGERILRNVEDYGDVAEIVRHHHERFDGEGYPDRLSGEAIPLLARVIAVADAYNAMTSDRPYRDAMPSRVARLRLAQAADTQFDTAVIAAFEAILAGADESYRMGTRGDFTLGEQEKTTPVVGVVLEQIASLSS